MFFLFWSGPVTQGKPPCLARGEPQFSPAGAKRRMWWGGLPVWFSYLPAPAWVGSKTLPRLV